MSIPNRLPRLIFLFLLLTSICTLNAADDKALRVGVFDIDATPPIGSPLAYDIMDRREASLRLKGIVLVGDGEPIAMVAVDWIGIGGEGHAHFRREIGKAIGVSSERVAVHCLHQHDAPRYDAGAEALLAKHGLAGKMFNPAHVRKVVADAADAARKALDAAENVTHIALGSAKVEKVASNRRILGNDGKVKHVRWTATRDPKVRAFPEGVIDPLLRSVAFYRDDQLICVATYYATHPQSFYRTKTAHPDFPGMAREARQKALGATHIHFNGASGNIGAGKYNDGSPANRPVLADRVSRGMKAAFERAVKEPVSSHSVSVHVQPVLLPLAAHLVPEKLTATLEDSKSPAATRIAAAKALALHRRTESGEAIDIACVRLGSARILHMPGELFVEYQLKSASLRPTAFVAMAAYGDYSPGYIGTQIAYGQGGYETSVRASRVAPEVEGVLMNAVREVLKESDAAALR